MNVNEASAATTPPDGVIRDYDDPSKTQAEATNSRVNSTTSTMSSPLDALVLACQHHEQQIGAASTTHNNMFTALLSSATTSTPHVVPNNQNTIREIPTGMPKTKTQSIRPISSAVTDVPSASTKEFKITNNDVLCGRGGLTNHHPGNVMFRNLVRSKQEEYIQASKREKAGVAEEIVWIMRQLDPPGRFLKKDSANPGKWVDIGDRKAREKTSQALREGAPAVKARVEEAQAIASTSDQTSTTPPWAHPSLIGATSITAAEQQNAIQATLGSFPRVRVVSNDSATVTTDISHAQALLSATAAVAGTTPNFITPLNLSPSNSDAFSGEAMDIVSSIIREGYSGSKRKVVEQNESPTNSNREASRGPRMKLLKARMADLCNSD